MEFHWKILRINHIFMIHLTFPDSNLANQELVNANIKPFHQISLIKIDQSLQCTGKKDGDIFWLHKYTQLFGDL